jgi:hypothetical protein
VGDVSWRPTDRGAARQSTTWEVIMTRPDEDLAAGEREDLAVTDRDLEAPPEDAAEQAAPVRPAEGAERPDEVHRRLEVGEWDAVEQSIEIDLEDDYER